MGNNANHDYGHGNRNLEEELNKGENLANKGFPHYGKKEDSESDDSFNNYDEDKKNPEQEGYVDDSDFGQIAPKSNPNPDESEAEDESIYEEENVDQKNTDLEEETSSDDDLYPNNEKNPEEKKDN